MGDSAAGSVTTWLPQLKAGDAEAVRWFVERFMPEVVRHARQRLNSARGGGEDEHDVAQEVFVQFLQQIESFEALNHRADLFQILAMLTRRRAIDAYRKAKTRWQYEQGYADFHSESGPAGHVQIDSHQVSLDVLDALQSAVHSIDCDALQTKKILQLRLTGHSISEIAAETARGERAIYRLLARLRGRLEKSGFDFR